MRIWLRSVVDAILGKVPGKTRGADIATRMAMDADFTDRRHPSTPIRWPWQERDDAHLTKPAGALADVGVLEESGSSTTRKRAMPKTNAGYTVPRFPKGALVSTTAAITGARWTA